MSADTSAPPRTTGHSATKTKTKEGSTSGAKDGKGKGSKPPLTPEQKTQRHFKSLCAQVEGGYFANAVRTCDKILRLNDPSSVPEALRTKVSCLLHLEKYTDALAVMDEHDAADPGGIERTYALYRLGRDVDAILPLLDEGVSPNVGRGGLHLRAQLSYRKGMYEDAVALYNELLDSCDINSEEYKDTETNLNAAQQHFDFHTSGFKSQLHTIDVSRLEELPPPGTMIPLTSRVPNSGAPTGPKARKPKPEIKGLDPERWIKKTERESYQQQRPRGGGGGKAGGATQGARVK